MPFRGRLLNRHIPGRLVAATALGVIMALTGSTVQAVPFTQEQAGWARPGAQDFGDPVEGVDAKAKSRPADRARKAAVTALDKNFPWRLSRPRLEPRSAGCPSRSPR
jgi:hypothetical protein